MICKECSFAICALHKIPWHGGQSCLEFDQSSTAIERLEQAEATAKLLASDESMICPNCEEGITRTEGCDHLMCKSLSSVFLRFLTPFHKRYLIVQQAAADTNGASYVAPLGRTSCVSETQLTPLSAQTTPHIKDPVAYFLETQLPQTTHVQQNSQILSTEELSVRLLLRHELN